MGRSGEYWRLLQPGPRLGRSSVLYVAVTHASILACLLKALTANCAPVVVSDSTGPTGAGDNVFR